VAATVALQPAPAAVAAAPYASAIAAPAAAPAAAPRAPVAAYSLTPPAPLLDVEAIERDIPIDFDIRAFDGTRRRRRNVILFVVFLLVFFGGMFALLVDSYTPHPH
jgi:hypothetical protein